MTPRDSQRSKYFKASEQVRNKFFPIRTEDELNIFFQKVRNSRYVKGKIKMVDRPGRRMYLAENVRVTKRWTNWESLAVHPDEATDWAVLEYFAWNLTEAEHGSETVAFHGPEYMSTLLALTKRFCGLDTQKQIKRIYIDHKVKTRATSAETRAKQRESYLERRFPEIKDELLKRLR